MSSLPPRPPRPPSGRGAADKDVVKQPPHPQGGTKRASQRPRATLATSYTPDEQQLANMHESPAERAQPNPVTANANPYTMAVQPSSTRDSDVASLLGLGGFVSQSEVPNMRPQQPGSEALGILADVALARGGPLQVPKSLLTARAEPTSNKQVDNPSLAAMSNYSDSANYFINHPEAQNLLLARSPSSPDESLAQKRPAASMTPEEPQYWPYSGDFGQSARASSSSYNEYRSRSEAAAALNCVSSPFSDYNKRLCVGGSSNNPDSIVTYPSSTAKKAKSSYITEQLPKIARSKQRVSSTLQDTSKADSDDDETPGSEEAASKTSAQEKGKQKSSAKSEPESTRDRPGDKYLKMFLEPEQQRYEEAILEILDGMQLPLPFHT